ncbi:hypothetical protein B0A52_06157 [Exophiala mesophila]|uniref:Arrestin-like N-terminal domain-containing protein n=1 Tax=Exophiala mesophila TaxID=212818 RepID=A0A438N5K9_EXOME|nr:hypothetical protein B0A52_06157 [Exophiala mesophila]
MDDRLFDIVLLKVRGIVLISHSDEASIEDLITLTDVKSLAHFEKDAETGDSVANFHFDLPIDAPKLFGGTRYLPQSGATKGHASQSPSPGCLGSPRIVEGLCEVFYWIDAEFRLKGQNVGCLSKHLDVSKLYPGFRISFQQPIHLPLKVSGGLFQKPSHEIEVNLSLVLQQGEPPQKAQDEAHGSSNVSLQLGLAMNAQSVSERRLPWNARQSLKCYIDYKWETKFSFATGRDQKQTNPDCKPLVFRSSSQTSTKRCCVYLRPEVVHSSSHYYSALCQLDLTVPKFIQEPSFQRELLAREYNLIVSITFDRLDGLRLTGIERVFELLVSPDEEHTKAIGDGDMRNGKWASGSQNDDGATKAAVGCATNLPLYC